MPTYRYVKHIYMYGIDAYKFLLILYAIFFKKVFLNPVN